MAKELLNEAERFLLKHWDESRLLEDSMKAVRDKYTQLWERVAEAVTGAHAELDVQKVRVTQFWAKGFCVFSRAVWIGTKENAWPPPGLWMEQLRIEKLSAEDAGPPTATIWLPLKVIKRLGLDPVAARGQLLDAARDVLTGDEFDATSKANQGNVSNEDLLRFAAPTKSELLQAFAEGDGQRFVDIIAARFDQMARLIPALDKIFGRQHRTKQDASI